MRLSDILLVCQKRVTDLREKWIRLRVQTRKTSVLLFEVSHLLANCTDDKYSSTKSGNVTGMNLGKIAKKSVSDKENRILISSNESINEKKNKKKRNCRSFKSLLYYVCSFTENRNVRDCMDLNYIKNDRKYTKRIYQSRFKCFCKNA